MSQEKLFVLGKHYAQYVEIERLNAAGEKPETGFGEPHFKRHSDPVSIPLAISHDGACGPALKVTGTQMRTVLEGSHNF